jgi:hypothetical protein
LRFKRDSKKQKRIQGAIPFRYLDKFMKTFDKVDLNNFNIKNMVKTNISSCDKSHMLQITQIERKNLEKFYTKTNVVKECMKNLYTVLSNKKIDPKKVHYLEPSAGAGVFSDQFQGSYDAYDIKPESSLVVKRDFLKLPLDDVICEKDKDLIVVGNPPYKLAIQFINRCAKLNPQPKIIAFVLPNVFKKPTIFNKIDKNYHIVSHTPLSKYSFDLGSESYDVPSGFLILERKSLQRKLVNVKINPIGFKFIPFSSISIADNIITGADISVIRVGGRAGRAFNALDSSADSNVSKQKYNYFIKLDKVVGVEEIVIRINQLIWELDNTTGPKSIGKYEFTPRLNEILSEL